MSRCAATFLLLLALLATGCSTGGSHEKAAGGCPGGQAPPCHEAPDHSNSGPGGAQGNGGGMGHGMM